MKKFLALAITLMMIVTGLSAAVSAGSNDGEFQGLTLEKFRYYDAAEVFNAGVSQRGYGASQDGKYLFGGFLAGTRAVVKFDAKTGDPLGAFNTSDEYPKGITTDDRGNLFVGLLNVDNKDYVSIAVVNMDTMQEVTRLKIDVGSGKVGVNGICVSNINGKYTLYAMVNYDYNRLYAIDVTDVNNMKVEYFHELEAITGVAGGEGQYMDADNDGYLYLSAFLNKGASKGDSVLKIEPASGKVVASVDCKECYGISHYGEYVAVSTYNGAESSVFVFDAETLDEVAEIVTADAEHAAFTGVTLYQNRIIAAEQNFNNQSGFWTVEGLNLPDEVVVEEVVEAPADGGTAESAPQTFDMGVIAAAAAVISAAGYAVSKKRR
ncbi:MAG: hypothetical protein IKV57_07610 [Clostridia bacterium]|nr:hypothetical protein [Clostridia bacterium]